MDRVSFAQSLKVEQLPHLHEVTKVVSEFCRKQLRSYLDAMAPLFRPGRLLGHYIEGSGRESVVGADQSLAQLRDLYKQVVGPPFNLRGELATPLESVSSMMQLYEWEYLHTARTSRGDLKSITVASPLTWVLCFPSKYSLHSLAPALSSTARDQDGIRAFVLSACLLSLLFTKYPVLADLLAGLRYRVEVRKSPTLGDLPLVTLTGPILCVRPKDDLVLMASALSGGSSFEEVLDLETARRIPDPLREQISEILREHGEDLGQPSSLVTQ